VIVQVLIALVSVAFGAFLSASLQFFFWKRQHREELKSLREREARRERERAVERLKEVGGLFIETTRTPVEWYALNRTELTTTTLIETYRLRRDLLNAAAAVRDEFPNQTTNLTLFLQMTEKVPLPPGFADELRARLDGILDQLRADDSMSDK